MRFKNAQAAIEFIILFGSVILFFVTFFAIIQDNTADKNKDKERILLQNIALNIKDEINLAAEASNGYFRDFTVPEKILGRDYQVNISQGFVYVIMGDHGFTYKIVQTQGEIKKGANNITKINQIIYLNK